MTDINQTHFSKYRFYDYIYIHNIPFPITEDGVIVNTKNISVDVWRTMDYNEVLATFSKAGEIYGCIAEAIQIVIRANKPFSTQERAAEYVSKLSPEEANRLFDDAMFLETSLDDSVNIPEWLVNFVGAIQTQRFDLEKTRFIKNPERRGQVYIIKSISGHYKIGRTKDINDRLHTFEVKLPFEIELEHVIESADCVGLEEFLHKMMASKRVNGEWFALDDYDIHILKQFKNDDELARFLTGY